METPVSKNEGRRSSKGAYKRPEGLNLAEAIAHYLDWAAKMRPHEYVMMMEIAYCAMDLRTRPRENSEDVDFCKGKMDSARKVLLRDYNRRVVFRRGLGYRATVDDLDMAKGPASKQANAVANATKKLSEIVNSIDVKKIPDTVEAAPYKEWVPRAQQQSAKLTSVSFRALLLPPGSPDKPDDKDKK